MQDISNYVSESVLMTEYVNNPLKHISSLQISNGDFYLLEIDKTKCKTFSPYNYHALRVLK